AFQGMHYLTGTPAVTVPTEGAFAYDLIGATAPTFDDGSRKPGVFTGRAGVSFAPGEARIGLEGIISIENARFGFQTDGGASNPGASSLLATPDSGHAFQGALPSSGSACPAGSCTANVQGSLFGPG